MPAIFLAIISLAAFFLSYKFYAKFLSVKIFHLDPDRKTPAHELEDGLDYVPTKKVVLFGHHFVSIAGLAPMLGPAIGVIWGWLPALLWVVFGTIFIGAVHDFASLFISIRNKGRSIGDACDTIINPRARILFLLIIGFLVALAMGVFTYIIALLFVWIHPSSVIPVFSLMVIAILVGILAYRTKLGITGATVLGVILMFIFIGIGVKYPIGSYRWFLSHESNQIIDTYKDSIKKTAEPAKTLKALELLKNGKEAHEVDKIERTIKEIGNPKVNGSAVNDTIEFWTWILLIYAFFASILPVWLLLQPRDYLNSFKLYIGLLIIFSGIFISFETVKAPALNTAATDLPFIFPFLFITIACGAISGFHCVVSSGTSAKQLGNEKDAKAIGYGGMVLEGILAVAAVLVCTTGFSSSQEWFSHYGSWSAAGGLTSKLNAFINGSAYLIKSVGIPEDLAKTFIAVVLVAFAMTSLDSGTRLLRYNFEELFTFKRKKTAVIHLHSPWPKKIICTLLAVVFMGYFALMGAGLQLWGLFGTTNQLLASFALVTAFIFLLRKGKNTLTISIPATLMFIITITAVVMNIRTFAQGKNWALLIIGVIILIMSVWLLVEAVITIVNVSRGKTQIAGIAAKGEKNQNP